MWKTTKCTECGAIKGTKLICDECKKTINKNKKAYCIRMGLEKIYHFCKPKCVNLWDKKHQ